VKPTTRRAVTEALPRRCAHCDYSAAQLGGLVELDRDEHPGVWVCSRGEIEYWDGRWAPKGPK